MFTKVEMGTAVRMLAVRGVNFNILASASIFDEILEYAWLRKQQRLSKEVRSFEVTLFALIDEVSVLFLSIFFYE